MQCPRCQHENRDGAKFCEECGSRFVHACPSCGHEVRPRARFCDECGSPLNAQTPTPHLTQPVIPASTEPEPLTYTPRHLAEKILTTRSALEGERKQVTVLFCDIANSTPLAARLGPEKMHQLLNRFFEIALDEIHHYEGTINQFLGDGFMALFGAPIAHEDHARRAVQAAVGLRRRLHEGGDVPGQPYGVAVTTRMGLHSGVVIVGAIGDNLRMDYTAVGDTTNVASRLQHAAEAGQIVISDATHRLVDGYCAVQTLGELSLKGKAEPVPAWEVLSARESRTRLEVEAEHGLTPYVGRERERQMVSDCFRQVRSGQGQVVFVVGEAGIGKSRFLLEVRRQLGSEVAWLEGHALSFGKTMAFHPLIDLLKRQFEIEENDTEATIIAKIAQGALPLGAEFRPLLPYLRYLLAVDPGDPAVQRMDPQLRRAELFDALRRLLLKSAEVTPQVLVFEDLHWVDQATEAFLTFIADSLPRSRILCLFTYRPGYVHPFGERTYHTRIALPVLSTSDTGEMARVMLSTEQLPEALTELIVQKSEGNPFYVEEVVKSLQEVGAIERVGDHYSLTCPLDQIEVPDSIQDVIMARIDRLPEAPKQTLQLASVIGREFTRRLLERLADLRGGADSYLQALKAIELIYETQLYPELAYMFKHALTQDVAYNSLLEEQRKELHLLIGQAIEELYTEQLAEHVEVLAHHYSRGESWDKALDYTLKAAEKATQAFATREAVALYDQGMEVVEHLGDAVDIQTVMAIHRARANLYHVLSDFERACAESAHLLTLARQTGDRIREGAALAEMGYASMYAHDLERGLTYSRQAIAVAETVDAKSILAAGHFNIGAVHFLSGRLDQARHACEQALTFSRAAGDVRRLSYVLIHAGFLRNLIGEYTDALQLLSDGLRLAWEHNMLIALFVGHLIYGFTMTGKGDYDEALATLDEGVRLTEKVGDVYQRARMLNSLGWLFSELGDIDGALELNRQGAEMARKLGYPEPIANAELNLADIFLAKGDLTLAQEFLDGVDRLTHDPTTSDWMRWRYSMHLFASLGEFWLVRGDAAKAHAFTDQSLDIATRTHSRKYMVKGWRLKGEIAFAQRQWDEAERWMQQALTLAQSVGNPTQLWKTHLALGRLHSEVKRSEQARQAYGAVRAVLDQVRASLHHPELRAGFEQSPMIQQVYDLSVSA